MTCSSCSTTVSEDFSFCPSCGEALEETQLPEEIFPPVYSSAVPDLILRHSPRQHPGMLLPFFRCLVSAFKTRRELALENLALRQQLAVLRRSVKRPRVSDFDRGFWVVLSRIWRDWRRSLVLVKPETVIL